jgi:C4-dicarboxylate transporter DctM subunit
MTGNILVLMMSAGTFTWIVSSMGAAKWLSVVAMQSGSALITLIVLVIAMLILGMILDTNVIQMVFIPIMVTSVNAVGIDKIHFGVLAALVCCLGLITPPVGMLIYMDAAIAKCSPIDAVKESLPYIAALILLVALMTFFPQIVTWLPDLIYSMG